MRSITDENETRSDGEVEHDEDDQHAGADRTTRLEHDRQPQHRAQQVGAGVAEHEPLAEVGGQQAGGGADHRRQRQARPGTVPGDQRDRHVGDQPDLDRATGRPVEQVAEVRGQRDQGGIGQQPPAAHLAGRRGQDDGDDPAPEQLHGAGRQATVPQRDQVASEPAVLLGAEQVVDEPEEREGEAGEEDHGAQEGVAQLLPHPELRQRRPSGLDDQHGEDDHQAAGGGQGVPSVVLPAQGR